MEGLPYRGVAMQVQQIGADFSPYHRNVDEIGGLGADPLSIVVGVRQENGRILLESPWALLLASGKAEHLIAPDAPRLPVGAVAKRKTARRRAR